ncbi:hypothetical protein [Mariniflexile sp. HMF6888]|uniref:hypothetical protein n=1 Tax=Mariniflexile sp. HMF6888 TaxID=3373086 RepID=UPI0037944DED
MKTLKKQIRIMALAIVLVFSTSTYAQNEVKKYNIYLRVYNLEGKQINKGSLIFINDSLLELKGSSKQEKISLQEIGFIKTKRAAGNNVLIGAASGAALGAIVGVSTADPDAWVLAYTAGEGALAFGGIGALGGAAIGGVTTLFKKSETFIINASDVNWSLFQKAMGNQRFK